MSEEKNKLTEISELGEFGLIKHITKDIELKHKSSFKGIGDDAAVIDYGNTCSVLTSDILVEGIHFNLIYSPLKHLGYKAVVVNLSDVYAMGATPKQLIVSIAISKKFAVEHIQEIYEGIKLACENYQVDLIGGDTSSSLTGLAISITAIGEAKKEDLIYRNTASKNDVICVTGSLGGAYMGLQLLEREKALFSQDPNFKPKLEGYDYILQRQLKPEARKEVIEFIKDTGIKPTAMIDISDGLSSELMHICDQSEVGCKIFQDKIPIDENTTSMANEFNMEPLTAALNGGEDYELLFTVDVTDLEKVQNHPLIHPIGHIAGQEHGAVLVTKGGESIQLQAQGWNQMRKE